MPLHDAVGINCKKDATLGNQSAISSIWVVYVDDCVCYLTRHDYPSLVEGETHGILLLVSELNDGSILVIKLVVYIKIIL